MHYQSLCQTHMLYMMHCVHLPTQVPLSMETLAGTSSRTINDGSKRQMHLDLLLHRHMPSACRKILPGVKHLSLACRGLSVCSSCFSWQFHSLNLIFCNASQNTLELLGNHTELSSSFEPNLRREFYRATVARRGEEVHEFGADLFDAFCETDRYFTSADHPDEE